MSKVKVFGYASGNAAEQSDCCMGPIVMESSPYLDSNLISWVGHLFPPNSERKLAALSGIKVICNKMAQHTHNAVKVGSKFVVIGGDHSSAIGTWSGAASAAGGPIGMIWVDAHMDSHTDKSSITKNIHGMCLAALLGAGSVDLTTIMTAEQKLAPQNVVIIGARSYETEEKELLENLGVQIIYMQEVEENGLANSFQKALAIAAANKNGFGISIDIDAFDPMFAPATAIKTSPGINPGDLNIELADYVRDHEGFLGLEIAEFFPNLDIEQKTEKTIAAIINSTFS